MQNQFTFSLEFQQTSLRDASFWGITPPIYCTFLLCGVPVFLLMSFTHTIVLIPKSSAICTVQWAHFFCTWVPFTQMCPLTERWVWGISTVSCLLLVLLVTFRAPTFLSSFKSDTGSTPSTLNVRNSTLESNFPTDHNTSCSDIFAHSNPLSPLGK